MKYSRRVGLILHLFVYSTFKWREGYVTLEPNKHFQRSPPDYSWEFRLSTLVFPGASLHCPSIAVWQKSKEGKMGTLLNDIKNCTVSIKMLTAATGDVLCCYSLKGFYFQEKGSVGTVGCVGLCVCRWTHWHWAAICFTLLFPPPIKWSHFAGK